MAKSDEEIRDIYNDAWNELEWGTPGLECERVALRAVYEAGKADA